MAKEVNVYRKEAKAALHTAYRPDANFPSHDGNTVALARKALELLAAVSPGVVNSVTVKPVEASEANGHTAAFKFTIETNAGRDITVHDVRVALQNPGTY